MTLLRTAGLLLVVLAGCRPAGPSRFAGSNSCATCHVAEFAAWRGSQHARAIQAASDSTVLAPFGGEAFDDGRIRATFLRRDRKFLVRTAGADGQDAEFTVTHTFGLFRQQYLVEMPGQASIVHRAWSRDSSAGGRRWYSSTRMTRWGGDPLHWTGIFQN
jgi:hypothetical protein